jgi:hypothetical protein
VLVTVEAPKFRIVCYLFATGGCKFLYSPNTFKPANYFGGDSLWFKMLGIEETRFLQRGLAKGTLQNSSVEDKHPE